MFRRYLVALLVGEILVWGLEVFSCILCSPTDFEEIAPIYLRLDELVVFTAYMLVGLGFVFLSWKEILSSEYALLLLAFALFATSIFLDAVPKEALLDRYFWE